MNAVVAIRFDKNGEKHGRGEPKAISQFKKIGSVPALFPNGRLS